MAFSISDPVSVLKGIGKTRAEALNRCGIHTLGDLVQIFPKEYRSGKIHLISPERVGLFSYFSLTVESKPAVISLRGKKTLRFLAKDEDGNAVHILYSNQPYLKNQIFYGEPFVCGGILQEKNGSFYLFSPQREKAIPDPNALYPVYPAIASLSSKAMHGLILQFLLKILPSIPETLPQIISDRFSLMEKRKALLLLHLPQKEEDLKKARERFAFEELFSFSVKSTLFADKIEAQSVFGWQNADLAPFFQSLPFPLTAAQKRVIDEIRHDLISDGAIPPMNRLLQGDVGSGKTVVAAAAAWLCAQNKKSTLLMAPTEILAEQHFLSFSKLFAPFGIPVFLLTGSKTKKEREAIFAVTETDTPYILIGTHALVEEKARCSGIGLAIIDEQHRFGVRHRTKLSEKGFGVHTLVMSATPIPRSLAMFLHAKSRISIIDELPPGRQSVDTLYVGEDKMERIYAFLKEKIAEGQKAYMVCPLIEDEENTSELHSAKEEWQALQKALPEIPSALLHGKMKPEEKAQAMHDFKNGNTKILVSTTVIEVGVDVPDATVMVIHSAERFGLSQLHQLRGRVGRGSEKSYCILISSHSAKSVRERLKMLCDTHDGFELAKYDLKTRGPGDFFGVRQSGFSDFSFTGAFSMELIQKAQEAASLFIESASDAEITPYLRSLSMN